jgi:hypothetical protein
MKTTTLASLVIAAATVASISLAQAGMPSFTAAYEQQGLIYQPLVPTPKARAEVAKELQEFRNNPISADGLYRFVGGEKDWDTVQHSYAKRDGKVVCLDTFSHDTPRPSLVMSAEEKRAAETYYGHGG